jgi:iron complex outermembrane receptor protein
MKKRVVFTLTAAALVAITQPAWAQDEVNEEFTLEEIMVTAEKRVVNAQAIPASVQALQGDDLQEQGKITMGQILENVPNVEYRDDTNITIRGVKKTQEAGGASPVPTATATYVDGIYEGMGGTFDINQVEVLRGPQGTLYGRSATGGVVAFHTNNPKLEAFGGNLSVEYGTGELINTQGAVNVPVGDKFALRAALHYLHQDEGYFNDDTAGENETKEGRIKALYQPTDRLSFILSASVSRTEAATGGWSQSLDAPGEINYQYDHTDPSDGVPTKKHQEALTVNYDLGSSDLTYIGAMYESDSRGKAGIDLNKSTYQWSVTSGDPTKTQTHELRWASNDDFPLEWLTALIGANYYKNTYNKHGESWQAWEIGYEDVEDALNVPLFTEHSKGTIQDYGIFTEETFDVTDDFRVTAGVRYDKLEIENYAAYDFNANLIPGTMAAYNPPDWRYFPAEGEYDLEELSFSNFTYKLRLEYDLTPENMVYAMTSTGFLPGNSELNQQTTWGFNESGMYLEDVNFVKMPYDQMELTAYEIGSKNRFMDNRMQLNGSFFYYDYEGYQEAINVAQVGPPNFNVVRVPVRMFGVELDFSYLFTQYDKVSLTAGYLDAALKSYPNVPGTTTSAKEYMYLKEVPDLPSETATLAYDHTFMLANGASLVPRVELHYTGGYYLSQVKTENVAYLDYIYQDDVTLTNFAATYSSASEKFSVTGYVRNIFDEEYVTSVSLPEGGTSVFTAEVGDPRTWGIMVSMKF